MHKFTAFLKTSLATRLISSLLFLSLHPTLAYAQTPVTETPTVVVAIIDQGVQLDHPALKNYIWTNSKENLDGLDTDNNGYTDDIHGWNFLNNNNNLTPQGGHGTKLAGLVAPKAQIMPLIACSQASGCDQAAIIKAIYYAVNNGARVINLSLGDTAGYKLEYNDAIKYAYNHNVIIVASTGSAKVGYDLTYRPMSPVCNDNGENMVLGVGTVDERGQRPAWANFGSCVDVNALGTNVYTTVYDVYGKNLYGYSEGNSFATASVSGQVASLIAAKPELTAEQAITAIIKTAGEKKQVNLAMAINYNQPPVSSSLPAVKTFSTPKVLGAAVVARTPKLVIR